MCWAGVASLWAKRQDVCFYQPLQMVTKVRYFTDVICYGNCAIFFMSMDICKGRRGSTMEVVLFRAKGAMAAEVFEVSPLAASFDEESLNISKVIVMGFSNSSPSEGH